MNSLAEYYGRRAPEYEQMWYRDDPVRQGEQAGIVAQMRDALAGRRVLEVACGTGYWTQFLVDCAAFIDAVDLSPEMLDLAARKQLPANRVNFRRGDAYDLNRGAPGWNGGLSNFWVSHVPKARLRAFLDGLHGALEVGSPVFMADNVFVPGLGGELIARPGCEDTFKLRTLADGSHHEVLKNYYTAHELADLFGPRGSDLKIHVGASFWWVRYLTARS